ncbi:MAG: BON domain-containing protein [Verrucomicrobia bacterium]|nr:BON domain-containing protein [Verrucomicrobiota bacterium]
MKAFFCFLLGVAAGFAGHWYLYQPKSTDAVADAKEKVRGAATSLGRSLQGSFDGERIKDELARTGKVIREKAKKAGEAIADAAANARITAVVKAKLVQDSGLAAFNIGVDTTDGVVTLSGHVASADEIAKAMALTLETDGVYKVVSTLQVKP